MTTRQTNITKLELLNFIVVSVTVCNLWSWQRSLVCIPFLERLVVVCWLNATHITSSSGFYGSYKKCEKKWKWSDICLYVCAKSVRIDLTFRVALVVYSGSSHIVVLVWCTRIVWWCSIVPLSDRGLVISNLFLDPALHYLIIHSVGFHIVHLFFLQPKNAYKIGMAFF